MNVVERVLAKRIENLEAAENQSEVIIVLWKEPPTRNERDVVEAVFPNVSSRIEETEINGLEGTDLYDLIRDKQYGKEYTSYYLNPSE
jgi:hypothetical protein